MDTHPGTVETTQFGSSLWVLRLAGEHDLSTAPMIAAAFGRAVESGTTVIVDCSETLFADSTVVGAMIQQARAGENVLVVAPRGGAVGRVFDLIGLGRVLQVFETRDEALRAVPPEDRLTAK